MSNIQHEMNSEETPAFRVGQLDLADFEIIDAHLHPAQPITLEESYSMWNDNFVDAMVPDMEFEGKQELRAKLSKSFESHLYSLPRQTGYFNYVARAYGVKPDLEGFDGVVSAHLKNFSAYITSIYDREKISKVVLQSREPEPVVPSGPIHSDRFVWTYSITELVQPDWAEARGLNDIQAVVSAIADVLKKCADNGCVGFKNGVAYYRPLSLDQTKEEEANRALKSLAKNKPASYTSIPFTDIAQYSTPELNKTYTYYQDYLLKRIFVMAGELEIPILIHSAVALHPALSFRNNNPQGLYDLFQDDEIRKAATQFVILHSGYPYHHIVASMISQFPNVYTDVSFYAKFPGVLEEILRTFLSLAPSEKVMHGSDSNNIPEETGYCASNTRRILSRILNDFMSYYGWTERDCEKIAKNVMSENAKRIFKI